MHDFTEPTDAAAEIPAKIMEVVNSFVEKARHNVAIHQTLEPYVFLIRFQPEPGLIILPLMATSDDEVRAFGIALRMMAEKEGSECVIILSEASTFETNMTQAEFNKLADKHGGVENIPGSQIAFVVSVEIEGGFWTSVTPIIPASTVGGHRTFGPVKFEQGLSNGELTDILPANRISKVLH